MDNNVVPITGVKQTSKPTRKQMEKALEDERREVQDKVQLLEQIIYGMSQSLESTKNKLALTERILATLVDNFTIQSMAMTRTLLGSKILSEEEFGKAIGIAAKEVKQEKEKATDERLGLENTDEPAAEGHTVLVSFVGKIDGTPFEGGSAKEMPVQLGLGQMLPDFETGLLGIKKDETKTFTVAFPADYHAEALKGKTAEFEVICHAVKRKKEKVDENTPVVP